MSSATIDIEEQQIVGISYNVSITFGNWIGRHHVRIVHLDDYNVIVGLKLLRRMRATVIPHLGGVQVMDEMHSCFVICFVWRALRHSTSRRRCKAAPHWLPP